MRGHLGDVRFQRVEVDDEGGRRDFARAAGFADKARVTMTRKVEGSHKIDVMPRRRFPAKRPSLT